MNNSHEKKARRIATLLAGYMRDNLTPAEHDELDEWVGASDKNMRLFEELTDERRVQLALDILNDNNSTGLVKKLKDDREFTFVTNHIRRFKKIAIAASLIIAGGAIAWFISANYFNNGSSGKLANANNDIPLKIVPASAKAILTLDGDKIITLENIDSSNIARQGNSEIEKIEGGIRYAVKGDDQITELRNKLTTPKGGFYKVVLPDGTIARLNANSSITYPTFFMGVARRVSVTGEVYFEVASAREKESPNYNKPFFVDVNDRNMTVEVLGTHFNVNAYADEKDVRTTLLEGEVKVMSGGNTSILKPGQQASVTSNGKIAVKKVDTDYDIAWMNHAIKAKQGDLRPALNVICRWYDLDLEFAPGSENNTITSSNTGIMGLDASIDQTVETLNETTPHTHFEVKGRKLLVTVTP